MQIKKKYVESILLYFQVMKNWEYIYRKGIQLVSANLRHILDFACLL